MEAAASAGAALLDLRGVEEEERASVWTGALPSFFPGLSVNYIEHRAGEGNIRRMALDQGELWAVRSPSIGVGYSPSGSVKTHHLSIMLQLAGRTQVEQRQRTCALGSGDLCLLDERAAFAIDGDAAAEILIMRLPRAVALGRHPHLEHHLAMTFSAAAPGTGLVGQMLSATLMSGPFFSDAQRRAALLGAIELLGTLDCRAETRGGRAWWRVQAALSFIELHFARQGLPAEEVAQAQRISRRRLDQLLSDTTGVSITGHIWRRRLVRAAADLRDPQRAACTASQIAFDNGFEDAAHFTRAFKRAYGHSPQQWRTHSLAEDGRSATRPSVSSTCDKRQS